jgi:hypothetical protein
VRSSGAEAMQVEGIKVTPPLTRSLQAGRRLSAESRTDATAYGVGSVGALGELGDVGLARLVLNHRTSIT